MELVFSKIHDIAKPSLGLGSFYKINNEYLLGDNGILLNKNSEVLWNVQWQHSTFYTMLYLKNFHVLITNRHAMPGPCSIASGICAIDMRNGKYLWKHRYENGIKERYALRARKEDDINIIDFYDGYVKGNNFITNGFVIDIYTGDYTYSKEIIKSKAIGRSSVGVIIPRSTIEDIVNYRGSIETFAINSESHKRWGNKFQWYFNILRAVRQQNLLAHIKIERIIEYFDKGLLIIGKDMKIKKRAIWVLSEKEK